MPLKGKPSLTGESFFKKNQILKQVQDEVQGKDCEVYELIRIIAFIYLSKYN